MNRIGDWELDTICPARGGEVIVSMNERRNGYVRLVRSIDGIAEVVADVVVRGLQHLRDGIRTLMCDRGSDLVAAARIECGLGVLIYYADPRLPWQRARNQKLSGLLLVYFPRAMNFRDIGFERLKQVVAELSN